MVARRDVQTYAISVATCVVIEVTTHFRLLCMQEVGDRWRAGGISPSASGGTRGRDDMANRTYWASAVLYLGLGDLMTHKRKSTQECALPSGVEPEFSSDPGTREVEIAFLERLAASCLDATVASLDAAQASDRRNHFAADYARIQNPVWARLAKVLAGDVPADAGFGRFRGRK